MPGLVAAAHLSCVDSFCKLARHCDGGEVREFGSVVAFLTGLPIAFFNGCLAMGGDPADVNRAIDWMLGRHVPYLLWMDSDEAAAGLGDLARRRGLRAEPWALPGMVLGQPVVPPAPPPRVRVEPASHQAWLAIVASNGIPPDLAERLFTPSFAADPDVALFTGYLDDVPVGTAVAIRTGQVSGVYAVVTAPPARRQGVGTAAAWAAVNAGRAWGCDLAALQATEMGFSSYARMGFETVVRYATFASPT